MNNKKSSFSSHSTSNHEKTTCPNIHDSHKLFAVIFSFAIVIAVISPITENWSANPKDSFPLSYYPMFTKKRSETTSVTYLRGLTEDGERVIIPYKLVGKGGFNQTRKQIRKSVKMGYSSYMCRKVASKIAKMKNKPFNDLVRIQIIEGKYNLNDYFTGVSKKPVFEKVYESCQIKRDKI